VTEDPPYVLDADVFMTAARSYYAFDVAPAFWDGLVREASNGRLLSVDRVKDEIERGKDELVEWANGAFHRWFAATDEADVIAAYQEIITWVQGQTQFFDYAKDEFARGADGWLIAYAKVKGLTVVTNEKFEPAIKRKVKIPNVCQPFGIPYINTFEMLRALGIKLG
jgi:Domain of unknown function (DUF4411)